MLSHLKISQKKQSVDLPLPPVLGMGSKASERKKSVDILPESICPNQMSRRRKSVDVFWPLDPGPTAKSSQEEKIVVPQIDPSVPQPVFTITEKAPTRAFSWLKAPTSAFTFKTLLRHYGKRALTPR